LERAGFGKPQGWLEARTQSFRASSLGQLVGSWKKETRLSIFLAINTAYMFMELVYGWQNNSLSLLSDACHMLLDNISVAIGLGATFIAARLSKASQAQDAARYACLAPVRMLQFGSTTYTYEF
jgi:Co/Zn/Cd efflux system component